MSIDQVVAEFLRLAAHADTWPEVAAVALSGFYGLCFMALCPATALAFLWVILR